MLGGVEANSRIIFKKKKLLEKSGKNLNLQQRPKWY